MTSSERVLVALCAAVLASTCGPDVRAAGVGGLWDMAACRQSPLDVEVVSSDVRNGYSVEELYLTSQATSNGPNRVSVTFARPTSPERPVPVFINLTGGPDSPEAVLWLAKKLECAVVDIEWRNPKARHRSKWACPTDLSVWHIGSEPTDSIGCALVTAARRVIDYLAIQPDIDVSRIACGGGSMGGYYSLLLAGVDDRVRCVFDTYGAGNLAKTGGRIGTGLSALTREQRRTWLAAFDPINYASRTSASVFVYLAANDYFFWLGDGVANFNALAGEKRLLIVPNYNHNFGAFGAAVPDCGWDWVEHCLHGKPAFPTVSTPRAHGGAYRWRAAGPLPITRSVLYWSPGNVSWPSRYWLPIPAALRGDTWTAVVPGELAELAGQVYVTVFDRDDRAVSSAVVTRRGVDPCKDRGPLWPGDSLWDTQRGPGAWRPTGPAAVPGPSPASVEAVGEGGLRIVPAKEEKGFALLTNSVVLAAGRASEYRGIRLVAGSSGGCGTLTVSLQRDSGSTSEMTYSTNVRYGPSLSTIDIPWCVFKGPPGAAAEPYPFDGLRLDSERPDGSALVIESIGLYGRDREVSH